MFRRYKVFGDSMLPAFKNGQYVLAEKISYFFREPEIDDIVVFKRSGEDVYLIKRIIKKVGLSYFLEGDNRDASTDSRHFGAVHKSRIASRIIML